MVTRKCRCGTVLNSYNTSNPPTCGPCEHTEAMRRVAALMPQKLREDRIGPPRKTATTRQKEILAAIGDGSWSIVELAEHVGISRQQIGEHLRELSRDGRVEFRLEQVAGYPGVVRKIFFAANDYESLMSEAS